MPIKFPPKGALAKRWQRVVELASTLPDMEESRSYGTPALKAKGKLVARLRSEDEGGLALRCDMVDRNMLIQADPDTFYYTDHYADYPMVLINLATVRWDAMPGLLEQAWRQVATQKMIASFDQE